MRGVERDRDDHETTPQALRERPARVPADAARRGPAARPPRAATSGARADELPPVVDAHLAEPLALRDRELDRRRRDDALDERPADADDAHAAARSATRRTGSRPYGVSARA